MLPISAWVAGILLVVEIVLVISVVDVVRSMLVYYLGIMVVMMES